MKLQDFGFILVFVALLLFKKPRLFLIAGLVCWLLAIPLFAKWVFFTGERLTWYGAGFTFVFLVFSFLMPDKVQ
jgi:hypothetical protein